MLHLESLIVEYLYWQGYLVHRNTRVGRLKQGGCEMELGLIGYNPCSGDLVHYEPSVDAHTWETLEACYAKKFEGTKRRIFSELFSWLPLDTPLRQLAIFPSRPKDRHTIAGGAILSADELVAEIRAKVIACGVLRNAAISENYPLLRVLQLSHCGYNNAL